MSNTNHPLPHPRVCVYLLANCKQFLFRIKQPPCYSLSSLAKSLSVIGEIVLVLFARVPFEFVQNVCNKNVDIEFSAQYAFLE